MLKAGFRSWMVLVLVLCFLLWASPGVLFAAAVPTGLVITDVVKNGATYDVTMTWSVVAGAASYKTQLGGVAAGAPLTNTYTFVAVPAGISVFGVCSVEGAIDSLYKTKSLELGGFAVGVGYVATALRSVGTMFLGNPLLVYVLALAVLGFVWARISRAIRR